MTTRIKIDIDVETRGVFLEHRSSPIIRAFFDDAKKLLTKTAQEELQQRAKTTPKHPTGTFAGAIVTKDLAKGRAVMAEYRPVLYGPWLEGTSQRNQTTRFKGYRMFKLTRNRLRKNVGPLIRDLFDAAIGKLRGGA